MIDRNFGNVSQGFVFRKSRINENGGEQITFQLVFSSAEQAMEKDFKKVLKDNLSLLHKSVCGIVVDESHTEDSALIFLLHIHPSLGYHGTKHM